MILLRTGMFIAAVTSTCLIVAVPAHADAADDFLAVVSAQGLNPGDTPADVQITLANAAEICSLLHTGYSPGVVGRQVYYLFPSATPQQVVVFVDAAQAHICGPAFGPLERW